MGTRVARACLAAVCAPLRTMPGALACDGWASMEAEFPRRRLHAPSTTRPTRKVTMRRFSLTHLSNEVLQRELTSKARNEKEATAELLAHIAEFDERKLYLPAAYPSMLAYCVGELRLSEDSAKKRIQVARVARYCPAVLDALAEGRVHLTGLRLLAPRLIPENADELLAAATGKSRDEIERILADRYPRLSVLTQVDATPLPTMSPASGVGAPGHPSGPEAIA